MDNYTWNSMNKIARVKTNAMAIKGGVVGLIMLLPTLCPAAFKAGKIVGRVALKIKNRKD